MTLKRYMPILRHPIVHPPRVPDGLTVTAQTATTIAIDMDAGGRRHLRG